MWKIAQKLIHAQKRWNKFIQTMCSIQVTNFVFRTLREGMAIYTESRNVNLCVVILRTNKIVSFVLLAYLKVLSGTIQYNGTTIHS